MSTLSKAAYARHRGVDRAHITRLGAAGRLVLTADGKVEVEASNRLIEATGGMRPDVAERAAQMRAAGAAKAASDGVGMGRGGKNAPECAARVADGENGGGDGDSGALGGGGFEQASPVVQAAEVFRRARTAKMHYESRRAVVRVARLQGRLAEVAKIRKCAGNDGATLRSLLENLPDQAAPRLAPVREAATAAHIVNDLLDDVAATMAGLLEKNIGMLRDTEGEA